MIDPKLELYYRNMRDMFRSEGWKQLLEDLNSNAVMINSVELTKDVEDCSTAGRSKLSTFSSSP